MAETENNPGGKKNKSKFFSNHFFVIAFGIAAIVIWIAMFGMGILIDSSVYRGPLVKSFDLFQFIMSIITFTPTNIAILCLFSAFLGGCASLLIITKAKQELKLDALHNNEEKHDSNVYMSENPFSSMLRGFIVFLAFVAGTFITNPSAFTATSPQLYTQAAGAVSFVSFIVGYDPTIFRSFISLGEKLKKK
jgi:hypothetical protein